MKRKFNTQNLLLTACLVLLFFGAKANNDLKIINQKGNQLNLKFELGNYQKTEVNTEKGKAFIFSSEEYSFLQQKGAPLLPKYSKSIIIPDKSAIKYNIVDSKYIEIENVLVAPSKGIITRDKNIDDIPYEFGEEYSKNKFYPENIIELGSPYIMRDYRGQVINIQPFQYNPVTKVLRVYTEISFDVSDDNFKTSTENILNRKKGGAINTEFEELYKSHFINFDTDKKYTALSDEGNMLVIAPEKYMTAMEPFVQWKKQKGLNIELVELSEVGTTADQIKVYVNNYYANKSLCYLLLIGDAEDVPSLSKSGDSDAAYGHITGSDSYAEVIVGRFSAETLEQVQTQVARTIFYERDITTDAAWLIKGIGIASAEGAKGDGDDGESDIQHMNNIRTDLLNFGYTSVDQTYDPGATPSNVSNTLNDGVGVINYVGHGSDFSWVTSGFSTTHVKSLTNENKLPFIFDVACVNGNFHGQTCFAESWMRATNNDNPTGAIAIIASTINQSWNSPMDGQDEMVDILINSYSDNIKRTFGGVTINGVMHMIDQYGDDGSNMANTWTIFGDPSVLLRTMVPTEITATHSSVINIGEETFVVNGDNDCIVALMFENKLIGSAKIIDGTANLSFDPISTIGTAKVTITGYNKVTYIAEVDVISPTSPYVIYNDVVINDASGNANAEVDFSESVLFDLKLKNVSKSFDAFNVNATLSNVDGVNITDNVEDYGAILKDETSIIESAFQANFANKYVDQQMVKFGLLCVGEDSDGTEYNWKSGFSVKVNAPDLAITDMLIDDNLANNNGILDPGETVSIKLAIKNNGHASISGLTAKLTSLGSGSDYLTLNTSEIADLVIDKQGSSEVKFNVTAGADVPEGTVVNLLFEINDLVYNSYTTTDNKELIIGEVDNILISQGGTVSTDNANFYDTGGKNNSYSNSESYIITFSPETSGKSIKAKFLFFDVESADDCSYDKLKVYNGTSTSSELLGTYCGTNSPETVLASNAEGALTFHFISDSYESEAGWEAEIRTFSGKSYQLIVKNSEGPLEGATVQIYGQSKTTDIAGVALFENLAEGTSIPVTISAPGFETVNKTVDLLSDLSEEIELEKITYSITFEVKSAESSLPIENAVITLLGETVKTNVFGEYIFENREFSVGEVFSVTKNGYAAYQNQVDINSNKTVSVSLDTMSYEVNFVVLDQNSNPMLDVNVSFNSVLLKTNTEGKVTFTEVLPAKDMTYILTKVGYTDMQGTIDVDADITISKSMSVITGLDLINDEELMIYPNPSTGIFNVDLPENSESNEFIIKVYDVVGSVVYTGIVPANQTVKYELDLTGKSKGIYILSVESEKIKVFNKRILLK
ncbi:MAG: T9SS type A sorting domain-containing protein [Bacteroidales bacterium]|nr:T9SS type A sorting domain-containing protein [Bacteroidales bacterium]